MMERKGSPIYTIPESERMMNLGNMPVKTHLSILNNCTPEVYRLMTEEHLKCQLVPDNFNYMEALGIKYAYADNNLNNNILSMYGIEMNDCVINALANLLDITWGEAHAMLCNAARQIGITEPNNSFVLNKVMLDIGYEKIYNADRDKNYPYISFKLIDLLKDENWTEDIQEKLLITIDYPTPHACCIKGGVIYDTFSVPWTDYKYAFVLFGRVTSIYCDSKSQLMKQFIEVNEEK